MIRSFVLALLLAVPGLVFPQQKIKVVATSSDLKSLVEAVGGARVEVESLASPEQDPHAIEIKPAQLAHLRRAALIVRVGLDHEPWFSRLSISTVQVLDVSRNVKLLQTQTPRLRVERTAHVHAYGNTHYWLDPENAKPITAAVLEALVRLSPGDAARFQENRDVFLSALQNKIENWKKALKPFEGTRVVVMHDSWSYFAERFGLQIAAAAEPNPGVPPSPAELAALFKRMRDTGVKILIADPHSDPALLRQIAARGGARPVTLRPSGNDYAELFEENIRRILMALKDK